MDVQECKLQNCHSVNLNHLCAVGLSIGYLLFISYCVLKVCRDFGVAERVVLSCFEA